MESRNETTAEFLRGQFISEDQSVKSCRAVNFNELEDAMKSVGLLHCHGCDLWTDTPFFDADGLCEECVEENSHAN